MKNNNNELINIFTIFGCKFIYEIKSNPRFVE